MATQSKKVIQYDLDGKIINTFETVKVAVEKTNINYQDMKKSSDNDTEESGFKFKIVEPEPEQKGPAGEGPKPVEEEKMIHVSESEFKTLMENMEKRLEAKFNKGAKEGASPFGPMDGLKEAFSELADNLNPNPGTKYAARFEESIDAKDFLDVPVKMFTYNHYFAIFGEMRYGHEVKTPYGRPIVFKNVVTQQSGRQVLYVAEAKIATKKELEWMRKSPMYGIIFHEKIKGDLSEADRLMAAKLSQAFLEIAGMTEYQIMQRATDEGLPKSTDVEVLRVGIIKKIAERNMDFEKGVSRESASSVKASKEDTLRRGTPLASTVV